MALQNRYTTGCITVAAVAFELAVDSWVSIDDTLMSKCRLSEKKSTNRKNEKRMAVCLVHHNLLSEDVCDETTRTRRSNEAAASIHDEN